MKLVWNVSNKFQKVVAGNVTLKQCLYTGSAQEAECTFTISQNFMCYCLANTKEGHHNQKLSTRTWAYSLNTDLNGV